MGRSGGFDVESRLDLPVPEDDCAFVIDDKSGAKVPVRPVGVHLPRMSHDIGLMFDCLFG